MKRLTATAFTLCALILSCQVLAVDLPKRGKFSGQFGWYGIGKTYELGPNHLFWTGEFSGTFFNADGKGFLHQSSVVCPASNDIRLDGTPGIAQGYCIVTDREGDKAFLVWQCAGPFPGPCHGDFKWIGGSGKYDGIGGNNRFQAVTIAPTSSGYAVWDGNWQLP